MTDITFLINNLSDSRLRSYSKMNNPSKGMMASDKDIQIRISTQRWVATKAVQGSWPV